MSLALREKGFEVCVAPDYRFALAELDSNRHLDLLLADVVMPQSVNGIALTRMARMRRPDIKVMYVTAYDLPGIEDEALGRIVRKPIDAGELAAMVERELAARQSTEQRRSPN
jgi:CheY-like chemotaxis protein